MATIFDGYSEALAREAKLKQKAQLYREQGIIPKIAAILFNEDEASAIYTRLKSEAAARVGIDYQVEHFSFSDPLAAIQAKIEELNQDSTVTGIIIQKPWTQKWLQATAQVDAQAFQTWWTALVSSIATKPSHGVNKDVDGLHPHTLASIKAATWMDDGLVLPATVRAIVTILKYYKDHVDEDFCYCQEKTLIIGRSDLVGRPLYWHVRSMMKCSVADSASHTSKSQNDCEVKLVGKQQFNELIEQKKSLQDYTLIISATGQKNLITADLIGRGTVIIDVGEPAGDVDFAACEPLASFITPVPGGVGPMTVVSLLANALDLIKNRDIIWALNINCGVNAFHPDSTLRPFLVRLE